MKNAATISTVVLCSLLLLCAPVVLASKPGAVPTPVVSAGEDVDLLSKFEQVMNTGTADCQLPCWWGFTPSIATFAEIDAFLHSTGFSRDALDLSLRHPEAEHMEHGVILRFVEREYPSIDFQIYYQFDKSATLQSTSISLFKPDEWLDPDIDNLSMSSIFQQMTEVPGIYIYNNNTTQACSIYLVFPATDIEVVYSFNSLCAGYGEHTQLCPVIQNVERVDLQIDDISRHFDSKKTDLKLYHPSQIIFGMTELEFFEYVRDNPEACLTFTGYYPAVLTPEPSSVKNS